MNRRLFIISSAVVAIGLPVAYYYRKNKWDNSYLTTPCMLSNICDKKTLIQIGEIYRKQVPGENVKQTLKNLIVTNNTGKLTTLTDHEQIVAFIDEKIRQEFQRSETTIIKNWIISITEARQCALLSLST